MDHGVRFVSDSGATLEQIISHVTSINGMILSIAQAAEQQATGLAQVNIAINDLDQTTQQNAAMVEETTAACHSLGQETGQLSRLVNEFNLGESGVASLRKTADRMASKITPKLLQSSGKRVRRPGLPPPLTKSQSGKSSENDARRVCVAIFSPLRDLCRAISA